MLLGAGASAELVNQRGETVLICAYQSEERGLVFDLLSEKGIDVNAVDGEGRTLLSYACVAGDFPLIEALLENDVIINCEDTLGFVPLLHALMNGEIQLAEKIVQKMSGGIAFRRNCYDALAWAKRKGYTDLVKVILEKAEEGFDDSLSLDFHSIEEPGESESCYLQDESDFLECERCKTAMNFLRNQTAGSSSLEEEGEITRCGSAELSLACNEDLFKASQIQRCQTTIPGRRKRRESFCTRKQIRAAGGRIGVDAIDFSSQELDEKRRERPACKNQEIPEIIVTHEVEDD